MDAMLEVRDFGREPRIVSRSVCPSCEAARLVDVPVPERWIEDVKLGALRGRLGLSSCATCGLVFTNPRPSRETLSAYYGGVIQPRANAGISPPATEIGPSARSAFMLELISEHASVGTLLDYGCTDGTLLEAAIHAGWRASGYDVGAALVRCRTRGLPVTDRLDAFADRSFDVIVLNQVMEHVDERDALLDRLHRLLAPGGKIVVQCPNVRSLRARLAHPLLVRHLSFEERYRAFPIHLAYFDASTLAALLARRGFSVEHTRTFGLGLEELFREPEPGTAEPQRPEPPRRRVAPPRGPSVLRRAKDAATRLFHRLHLGEHVVVVASRRLEPAGGRR
jgi:SAM-dependent methyltransferase